MSAPKVGDRVKVEWEGTVKVADFGRDGVLVEDAARQHSAFVPKSACTVLAPPVKVGDIVTAENIEQLPAQSVIAYRVAVWRRGEGGRWVGQRDPSLTDAAVLSTDNGEKPRVLRIGGTT